MFIHEPKSLFYRTMKRGNLTFCSTTNENFYSNLYALCLPQDIGFGALNLTMRNINKEMFRILTKFQVIKGIEILDTFLRGQIANISADGQRKIRVEKIIKWGEKTTVKFSEKSRGHFAFSAHDLIICKGDVQRKEKT